MSQSQQDSVEQQLHLIIARHDGLHGITHNIVGGKKLSEEHCVHCRETAAKLQQLMVEARKVTGDTSDGYHTFNELYEFRLLYNAALFNEWWHAGKYNVHKSERHSDGELAFGGGWFVVVAELPTGQITNHYEMKDWYLFKCRIAKRAAKWDGHTPQDVVERLKGILPTHLTQSATGGEEK